MLLSVCFFTTVDYLVYSDQVADLPMGRITYETTWTISQWKRLQHLAFCNWSRKLLHISRTGRKLYADRRLRNADLDSKISTARTKYFQHKFLFERHKEEWSLIVLNEKDFGNMRSLHVLFSRNRHKNVLNKIKKTACITLK